MACWIFMNGESWCYQHLIKEVYYYQCSHCLWVAPFKAFLGYQDTVEAQGWGTLLWIFHTFPRTFSCPLQCCPWLVFISALWESVENSTLACHLSRISPSPSLLTFLSPFQLKPAPCFSHFFLHVTCNLFFSEVSTPWSIRLFWFYDYSMQCTRLWRFGARNHRTMKENM